MDSFHVEKMSRRIGELEAKLAALGPLARAAVALDGPVEDAIELIARLDALGRAVRALPAELRHELAGPGECAGT